jgi:hypothetical protein
VSNTKIYTYRSSSIYPLAARSFPFPIFTPTNLELAFELELAPSTTALGFDVATSIIGNSFGGGGSGGSGGFGLTIGNGGRGVESLGFSFGADPRGCELMGFEGSDEELGPDSICRSFASIIAILSCVLQNHL